MANATCPKCGHSFTLDASREGTITAAVRAYMVKHPTALVGDVQEALVFGWEYQDKDGKTVKVPGSKEYARHGQTVGHQVNRWKREHAPKGR